MASMKSFEMSREIADVLRKKPSLAGLAFTETTGTANDPIISIGPGTTRGKNVVIRLTELTNPTATDSLNLTAGKYGPHVAQLATEANFAGTTDNIADNIPRQMLLDVLGEVIKRGSRVEWWEEADGTAPSETTYNTASKLKASWAFSSYWPLAGS
jgi:hypothetical protein